MYRPGTRREAVRSSRAWREDDAAVHELLPQGAFLRPLGRAQLAAQVDPKEHGGGRRGVRDLGRVRSGGEPRVGRGHAPAVLGQEGCDKRGVIEERGDRRLRAEHQRPALRCGSGGSGPELGGARACVGVEMLAKYPRLSKMPSSAALRVYRHPTRRPFAHLRPRAELTAAGRRAAVQEPECAATQVRSEGSAGRGPVLAQAEHDMAQVGRRSLRRRGRGRDELGGALEVRVAKHRVGVNLVAAGCAPRAQPRAMPALRAAPPQARRT